MPALANLLSMKEFSAEKNRKEAFTLKQKAKVFVLGTFHMFEHEGLDSEKRQLEIGQLVSKLGKFKPTKIAVEIVPKDSKYYNEKYKQCKLGIC